MQKKSAEKLVVLINEYLKEKRRDLETGGELIAQPDKMEKDPDIEDDWFVRIDVKE